LQQILETKQIETLPHAHFHSTQMYFKKNINVCRTEDIKDI